MENLGKQRFFLMDMAVDWGNATWADTARLGSIGIIDLYSYMLSYYRSIIFSSKNILNFPFCMNILYRM